VSIPCRAANESSWAELGLTQARLMKIRVESSRARETVRAEKPSSNSARYYSSWLTSQYMCVDSIWYLDLIHLQTIRLVYLEDWYKNWLKIDISTNYFFNDIFAALIWMDGPTSSQIYESNYERVKDVFKPLTWWGGERWRERSYRIRVRKKNITYFLFELSRATSRADPNSNSAHLTTEPD
jgi:hypothetical protein